ncbi:hypothetical protein PHYC_02572 [Phycisphaerales bacterium]|nr:hypothetical protein PHYC_02572 [Phycisphaerales bacterium]
MPPLLCVVSLILVACQPAPQAEAPTPSPAPVEQTPPPANPAPADAATPDITTADQLLDELERADAKLRSLVADIKYDRVFEIQGDRQIRVGKVYYQDSGAIVAGVRDRKFGIRFTSLQIGKRLENEVYEVIFDGQWLVERRPAKKEFTKTQIARPGRNFDALRVGQGPFPLPVGQKKADMLARYEAALLPGAQGLEANDEKETPALLEFVKGACQLKLTIRPELKSTEELHEIRLWYKRDAGGAWLPRLARTMNRAGDVSLVQMINVALNESVPTEVLDTTSPKAEDGWNVQVREMTPEK